MSTYSENKEEFNEHSPKRQYTGHQNTEIRKNSSITSLTSLSNDWIWYNDSGASYFIQPTTSDHQVAT